MSNPTEAGFDALGKGVDEGRQPPDQRYMSKGLTRSRKLASVSGSGGTEARGTSTPAGGASAGGVVTALASHRTETAGATALKPEPEAKLSPAQQLDNLPWAKADARAIAAEKRAEAKAQGYEGEACGECGNFTLVRNGTCMKCNTCGSTTGCS